MPRSIADASDTTVPDARFYAVLAEAGFGAELFNPTQHRSCELVERYAHHQAVEIAHLWGDRQSHAAHFASCKPPQNLANPG